MMLLVGYYNNEWRFFHRGETFLTSIIRNKSVTMRRRRMDDYYEVIMVRKIVCHVDHVSMATGGLFSGPFKVTFFDEKIHLFFSIYQMSLG